MKAKRRTRKSQLIGVGCAAFTKHLLRLNPKWLDHYIAASDNLPDGTLNSKEKKSFAKAVRICGDLLDNELNLKGIDDDIVISVAIFTAQGLACMRDRDN